MKTSHILIILGIIITGSIIFALTFEFPFEKEHYEIKITGMKDVYLAGEQYDFSYIISGYGYSCGSKYVTFPDQNGEIMTIGSGSSCIAGVPMKEFVIDSKKEYDTTSVHGKIQNLGRYNVTVTFDRPSQYNPTTAAKEFHVVERICDDPKTKVQCFNDSSESCTSAYIKINFPTGEGDPIHVTGVVESWNGCTLQMYLDTTQDRYGGHSTGILRSVCDDVIIKEDYWTITGCNNFDLPKMEYVTSK